MPKLKTWQRLDVVIFEPTTGNGEIGIFGPQSRMVLDADVGWSDLPLELDPFTDDSFHTGPLVNCDEGILLRVTGGANAKYNCAECVQFVGIGEGRISGRSLCSQMGVSSDKGNMQ